MNTKDKQIWFRAKKYGWGWGLPCAWQGWVVFALFAILPSIAAFALLPGGHFVLWMTLVIVLVVAMFITCLVKGETPRWRWGESKDERVRSAADRLAELDELHRRQLVSDVEYEAKRQEILGGL